MQILITGGTGTLGQALIKQLTSQKWNNIWVFSRDENKQKSLQKKYPQLNFIVGDVSNPEDISEIGDIVYDHIYHCAAMKHIEICESHVIKCNRVNFEGTVNLYRAYGHKSDMFTFFSTDKAVAPINAYGYSKAMAEKYLSNFKNVQIFRWGNILGSTGSVLPILCECCVENKIFNVTDAIMTRFWVHIDDAAKFVCQNKHHTGTTAIYPSEMVSSSLDTLINAVEVIFGKKIKRKVIGKRPGEKKHEAMIANYDGIKHTSASKCMDVTEMVEHIYPWVIQWKKSKK